MKFISLNTKLQKDMEEIILYTKEYMPTYTHIHTHTQTHICSKSMQNSLKIVQFWKLKYVGGNGNMQEVI